MICSLHCRRWTVSTSCTLTLLISTACKQKMMLFHNYLKGRCWTAVHLHVPTCPYWGALHQQVCNKIVACVFMCVLVLVLLIQQSVEACNLCTSLLFSSSVLSWKLCHLGHFSLQRCNVGSPLISFTAQLSLQSYFTAPKDGTAL